MSTSYICQVAIHSNGVASHIFEQLQISAAPIGPHGTRDIRHKIIIHQRRPRLFHRRRPVGDTCTVGGDTQVGYLDDVTQQKMDSYGFPSTNSASSFNIGGRYFSHAFCLSFDHEISSLKTQPKPSNAPKRVALYCSKGTLHRVVAWIQQTRRGESLVDHLARLWTSHRVYLIDKGP